MNLARPNDVTKAIATLDPSRKLYLIWEPLKTATRITAEDSKLWHLRLGHIPCSTLFKLRKLIEGPQSLPALAPQDSCKNCHLSKSIKLQTTEPGSSSSMPLQVIHSHLSGNFLGQTRGGFQDYVTFRDDFTGYVHMYLLKNKNGVLPAFRQ